MFKGIAFLFRYTWQVKKRYIIYQFLLQILTAVIPLADIIIPKYIIDELTTAQRPGVVFQYIALLVGINFLGSCLINLLNGKIFLLDGHVFTQFQTMMTQKMAQSDFARLEDPQFLDIKAKAEKFLFANGRGFGVVLRNAFNIIGKLFTFIGIVAVISTLNFGVLLIFILVITINAVYESKVRKQSIKWNLEKAPIERRTKYFLDLVENFAFGKEIRIFGLKDWLTDKVHDHLVAAEQFYQKQIKLSNKAQYVSSFTNFILKGLTYVFLCIQVLQQAIGIGDFTMYVNALTNFSNAMRSLMFSLLDIRQFSGYYDALMEYMNIPQKMYEGKCLTIPQPPYQICFEDVSFRYPGQDHDVLRHINLTLCPNEKLSIVGENGAGKTTFVKLLCRLYDPTQGRILLNGIDIRDIAYDQYMSIIGTVFQDYKLLAFTLKENVAFCAANTVPDIEVNNILCKSGLQQRLDSLIEGIHTHIYKTFSENGFEPSGGEGQKIALARALYKDAPIMILDEPTSALDPRAEYEIYRNFSELTEGKMTIFISHRMSSSKFCDRIALFSNGEIIEYGTHEELMEKGETYRELFDMQAQYYI